MGNLDDFVDNLQEHVFNEAREAYGEKGFQRWRNPRYHGRMAAATHLQRKYKRYG